MAARLGVIGLRLHPTFVISFSYKGDRGVLLYLGELVVVLMVYLARFHIRPVIHEAKLNKGEPSQILKRIPRFAYYPWLHNQ